jgi:hypothetical protein
MAGLFSLASFDRHVSARCISPSGSLLTTRVNMFLLTGEALTDASQALSSYSSAFDRFEVPSACVGRPTLVLRTESQRQFGFSKLACMDSATTLVVPEPLTFGSSGANWDPLSGGSLGTCLVPCRCRSFRPVCNGGARHAQTDACNPDLVFKDGHPHLVRLLPPVPNRLCGSEPTVTPRRARFGGHIHC